MKITRIEVRNSQSGNSTLMEVEGRTKVQEILDSAVAFWSMSRDAYLIRCGKKLLSASSTVEESGLKDGDTVELLPDPEGG